MKKFKKALSLLLVGVIAVTSLFCGTVTASAADIPYSVRLSAGDTSNLYYVDVRGITKNEYNFLKDPAAHGYCFKLVFNKGKSDEIVLYYADVRSDDMSFLLSVHSYNKQNFYSKTATFVTANNGYNFVFQFDTDDKRFYTPIDELKKCTECDLVVFQNEGDNSKNYYGYDIEKGVTVPFTVDKDVSASSNKTSDTKTTSAKKISDLSISSISSKAYTGKAIKPDVTVKDGTKTLKSGTDYTLSYKNNTNIGKAAVTITGKGSYTGTKSLTFKIVPAKTTLTAKKSNGKYTLSWKKVSGIDKYQIQYSTDGGKTYKSAGTAASGKTSKTIKLDTGKSYTFRIRSYKTVDGKKYYSGWSKTVKA